MDYTIRIGGRHDKHGPRNSNEEEPMETANDRNSAEALDPARIGEAVYRAVRECATTLRPDFKTALESAGAARAVACDKARDTRIIGQILENARIGERDGAPICQDTGTVWVCLEVGEELCIPAMSSHASTTRSRAPMPPTASCA